MNATQLLEELKRRAVVLWVEGEGEQAGLGYEAPPGVLKPPVLAAMKASKRELLALLQTGPQVLEAPSTWGEVLRPDLRDRLGLEALDLDPPEPPPLPGCQWVRDLGVWQRCGGMVPTDATRAARVRYYEAKQAWRSVPHDFDTGQAWRDNNPQVLEAEGEEE